MGRQSIALTPEIQARMGLLSSIFAGWEEDCANCKAFADSLGAWSAKKGSSVIVENETDTPPLLVLCADGAVEVLVATTTKTGAVKQKRISRMNAPFYIGEGRIIGEKPPTATVKAAKDLKGYSLSKEQADELLATDALAIRLVKRQIAIRAFERAHTYVDGLFFGNIDNPAFFDAFAAFAKRSFCAENVVFLRGYRDIQKMEDLDAIDTATTKLFTDHIDVDTSDPDNLAVNVSQKCVVEAKWNRAAAKDSGDAAVLRQTFDKCASEINQMLSKDIIPNFIAGDEYAGFLLGAFPMPSRKKKRSGACAIT